MVRPEFYQFEVTGSVFLSEIKLDPGAVFVAFWWHYFFKNGTTLQEGYKPPSALPPSRRSWKMFGISYAIPCTSSELTIQM